MRVSSTEENNDVLFVISEYPPEFKDVFESTYYSLVDGSYVKRFPKDTPNVSRIRTNWANYGEEMLLQMG